MGYLWALWGVVRACLALMFYTLRAGTPEPALWAFQGWLPIGQVVYGRLAAPLDAPCHVGLLLFLAFRVRVDQRR
jgi:hypothetical protein